MPQNVHCTVTNCRYWGTADNCNAQRIEVALAGSPNARGDAGRFAGDQAATSYQTCCVTFKPR